MSSEISRVILRPSITNVTFIDRSTKETTKVILKDEVMSVVYRSGPGPIGPRGPTGPAGHGGGGNSYFPSGW